MGWRGVYVRCGKRRVRGRECATGKPFCQREEVILEISGDEGG
jgi:hypothetical protein